MSVYQILPDTYDQPTLYPKNKPVTNERYSNFTQTHFTAGDFAQFEEHRNPITLKERVPNTETLPNLTAETVVQTFSYMFDKFKKGIFVQIRDNHLNVFLPFSNANYINEWHSRVQGIDSRAWVANNYLFRSEVPYIENDIGVPCLKHMLETLCKTHTVPDLEFFINKRDFPLFRKDRCEPYEAIYGKEQELLSHNYEYYLPCLSMVGHSEFNDIPIPTPDEWTRICTEDNIFFPATRRTLTPTYQGKIDTPSRWSKRPNTATFRGSLTGKGTTAKMNLRWKLWTLAQKHPDLLEVGITGIPERGQLARDSHGLITVEYFEKDSVPIQQTIPLIHQANRYKYIVHIAGHVQSYRLSEELGLDVVVLKVNCPYKMWFEEMLVPWVHYVPVKGNLSDLIEQINWCNEHPVECLEIIKCANMFFHTHLGKEGCMNRLFGVMNELARQYVYRTPTLSRWKFSLSLIPVANHVYKKIDMPVEGSRRCWMRASSTKVLPREARAKSFFKSKSSELWQNGGIVYKKCLTSLKHEEYVGIECTNRLLKIVPNFRFTYGLNAHSAPTASGNANTDLLAMEHIQGQTLLDYLKSRRFIFSHWLFLMQQVLLALEVAQRRYYFTHHDCCPWNIILYECREQTYDYTISDEEVVRIKTSCIPVIIDYGRSTAIVNDTMVFTASGNFQRFQDAICLLVSCSWVVLANQKLNAHQTNKLLELFNSVFTKDPEYYTPCHSEKELKTWLDGAHKYANLSAAKKKTDKPLKELWSQLAQVNMVYKLENTSYGKVRDVYHVPTHKNAVLQRYIQQQLSLITGDGGSVLKTRTGEVVKITKEDCELCSWPRVMEAGDALGKGLLFGLCAIEELLTVGGTYRLSYAEEDIVRVHFGKLLEGREALHKVFRDTFDIKYVELSK